MISNDISVVLNVYKRPHTLEKQIESLMNQSINIKPENIHVWYNKSNISPSLPKDEKIKTYTCNYNTKFWGRFTIPFLLDTKYVALFDDDIYPQSGWIENCLSSIEKCNGILGGSGVELLSNNYRPHKKYGWNGIKSNNIERVDLVGHAWFFKQEWIKYMWYEKPVTWDNGEDIMFSYLAQKYGGINTFVPPHPENEQSKWSSDFNYGMSNGNDNVASFKLNPHYSDRNKICNHCISNGWKTKNSK